MDKPDEVTLRRLYVDEQKSLVDIGRIYGKHPQQVARWMDAVGIPRRDARTATMLTGKYGVQNEAHREKLRLIGADLRKRVTAEGIRRGAEKRRGRVSPNRGKPWTPEQRAAQMVARSTDEYREKLAAAHRGEKSHLWRGGITDDSSLHGWQWRQLRREVYERDGWTCQECGVRCLNTRDAKKYPKRKVQAHHKVPRRAGGGDSLDNLVTLCMSCHHKIECQYKERE